MTHALRSKNLTQTSSRVIDDLNMFFHAPSSENTTRVVCAMEKYKKSWINENATKISMVVKNELDK